MATSVMPSMPFVAPARPARPARLLNSEVLSGLMTGRPVELSNDLRLRAVTKIRSKGRFTPSVNVAVAMVIGQMRRSIRSIINRRSR